MFSARLVVVSRGAEDAGKKAEEHAKDMSKKGSQADGEGGFGSLFRTSFGLLRAFHLLEI